MEETHKTNWIPSDTLANRLRLIRGEIGGVSQAEAARRVGITPRIWQGMEEGRSPRNEIVIVRQVAHTFGVNQEWLMFGGQLKRAEMAMTASAGKAVKRGRRFARRQRFGRQRSRPLLAV